MKERVEHNGIVGVRVGRFRGRINTTCIAWRIGTTLIDTGPPNRWAAVRRFLEESSVERVLLTHHHEDHSGNAARIRNDLGIEVFAPPGAIGPLRSGFPLKAYQHVVWGRPGRFEALPVPETVDAGGGFTLRALHSPGHSPDMTCYLEPKRGWLFTGDLFLSKRTVYMREDETFPDLVESLRAILEVGFDTILCSHRGVVENGEEEIRAKLAGLEELRGRVAELHREGQSETEITRKLLGKEGWMSAVTGYHLSKRNLVRGCIRAIS